MAIQKIQEGISGLTAANIIYENDLQNAQTLQKTKKDIFKTLGGVLVEYSVIPLNPTITNPLLKGFYVSEAYAATHLRTQPIGAIGVHFAETGTFTVFKATGVGSSANFSYSVVEIFEIMAEGYQILEFTDPLTLEAGELIGFRDSADSSVFLYYAGSASDGVEKQNYRYINSLGAWVGGSPNNSLSIDFYGTLDRLDRRITDLDAPLYAVVPVNSNITPYSNASLGFFPTGNALVKLRQNTIKGISLQFQKSGTITFFKSIGSGEDAVITVLKVFNVGSTGWVDLIFDAPVSLLENEFLGWFDGSSDTSTPLFNSGNVGISFFSRRSDNSWNLNSSSSLNFYAINESAGRVSVLEEEVKNIPEKKYLKGVKLSFLGDSITTLEGSIPVGNAHYYPRNDVNTISDTWWGAVIENTGALLEVNNSWSGSRYSNTGSGSMSSDSRLSNLGDPDAILVFGGTNDFSGNIPLGDINFETENLATLIGGLTKIILYIKKEYPSAKLIIMSPTQRARYSESPTFPVKRSNGLTFSEMIDKIKELCELTGTYFLDMSTVNITYFNSNQDPEAVGMNANLYTYDGLHPNAAGMQLIATKVQRTLEMLY